MLLINTFFVAISDARDRGIYSKFFLELEQSTSFDEFGFLATGIADLVRQAVKRGLSRFLNRQTSYDSDVFRYTFASQFGRGELFGGESCRLSPMICSHDEQCCSGRCLCRRWTITGEERCVRKCF